MAKKRAKTESDEGAVFKARGSAFRDEDLKEFSVPTSSLEFDLGYDPDWLSEKAVMFGQALTGVPLYEYQMDFVRRVVRSVVGFEGETITALWSRQSGKSESLAFVVDTLCVLLPALAKIIPALAQFKDGIKIGLFAPQSDQVVTTYTRALNRLKSDNAEMIMADPEIDTGITYDSKLLLTNGSSLTGQTAGKTSKIESKTYDLIFIEEAQDMDDFLIQKSIEPMATATNGTIVKVGTTGTRKNDFYHEIQRNARRSIGVKSGLERYHFEYNYKEVIRQKRRQFEIDQNPFHLNYERYIAKIIAKRGKDAPAFKLSYALIWDLESGMFISDDDWNKIINKKYGFVRTVEPEWDIRAGLDIAKDDASTILTIGRVMPDQPFKPPKKQILRFIELRNMDYEMQHQVIVDYLIEYNVRALFADYTGVGRPFVDRLSYACGNYLTVEPYTFSRPSKSEMWLALRADIDNRRLIIPANDVARGENEYKQCEAQLKGMIKWFEGGYLVAEKSEDPGYDDYGDSLGLFVLAGNMEVEDVPEVEEETNPFFTGGGLLSEIGKISW
jgi:hypothetical protein